MAHDSTAEASLLIASDSSTDAALVRSLLAHEFGNVAVVTLNDISSEHGERGFPDVLILAFKELMAAEQFYLGFYRHATGEPAKKHRTVVLCSKDDVRAAYQLCRRGLFDDYVLFWPMTADVMRLPMAIHTALANLAAYLSLCVSPAQSARTPAHGIDVSVSQPKVLIVDDDDAQRRLIGRLLKAATFESIAAASGEEALSLLAVSQPDVMLLDLHMPGMTGCEVLERMRAKSGTPGCPVIVVTGAADRETVLRTRELGAVDFVVKPFDSATLIGKLRRALRQGVNEEKAATLSP